MGILIACSVIGLWGMHLVWTLTLPALDFSSPIIYLHIVVQGYLYTGLFITAHDSMHGSVSKNRRVNRFFGQLCLWLFAAFPYQRMFVNHMEHHKYPGTGKDPDFSLHQDPFRWFLGFFFSYVTVLQIVTMALLFNFMHYVFKIPHTHLILLWVVPAFLGTFQLFYFGTFIPHRLPHTPEMAPHRSRTQKRNHLAAMLSCWFFGYHWEHHEYPNVPWWRLHTKKKIL
ncbi:MAG: fatty acid desaturase [Spirochaetia bacterium]|nr:fatty acid desaturase [Spirochaetia bacterium]